MALSANTVWEVRTTGSDTLCSGGFVAGASGTDYSQQNAAQYTGTDLAIDATTNTKVTSASHSFVSTDVGNLIQVTAGTGFTAGFFQIVSVASGAATLDRSAGTLASTGGTYAVGGALATMGKAGSAFVAGNILWIKGNQTVTSATANVAGGCISIPAQAASANSGRIRGYGTTRGDGVRPTILASGITSFALIVGNTGNSISDLILDGGSLATSRGLFGGQPYNVKAQNFTNSGLYSVGDAVFCEVTGCTTLSPALYVSQGVASWCWSHDNTVTGVWATSAFSCLSTNNTGASSRGFDDGFTIQARSLINCTAYGNGADGFKVVASNTVNCPQIINCISYGNGGAGYLCSGDNYYLRTCAGGSNTSGNTSGFTAGNVTGFITLTADPFTNKAGNDYSINNTAGGGVLLRALGLVGAFPGGTTTSYLDVGAAQHQDAGGKRSDIIHSNTWVFVE